MLVLETIENSAGGEQVDPKRAVPGIFLFLPSAIDWN